MAYLIAVLLNLQLKTGYVIPDTNYTPVTAQSSNICYKQDYSDIFRSVSVIFKPFPGSFQFLLLRCNAFYLTEKRRYWKLKEEALDRTLWRTRFGRGYRPVVRQTIG
jgi:hypothetical protein